MKKHTFLGKIILLLVVVSSLMLICCRYDRQFKEGYVYIYQGYQDSSYFEYNVRVEVDSVYSFIRDSDFGYPGGYRNTSNAFVKDGLISHKHQIRMIRGVGNNYIIEDENEKITLILDTFFLLSNDYFMSIQYEADFVKRKHEYLGIDNYEFTIKREGKSTIIQRGPYK